MRTRLLLTLLILAGSGASALAEQRHCQLQSLGEMPAQIEGRSVITDGEVDGHPVRLVVDTGAWGTLLFESEARQLGLFLRPVGANAYGVGGAMQVYSARVKEFRLGSLSERNADMVVTGQAVGPAQGVVGARFLLQADVEFDLPHGKIRFFKPHDCAGGQVVYWGEAYAVAPMIPTRDDRIVVQVRVDGAPVIAQMDTGASSSVLTTATAVRAGVTTKSAGVVSAGAAHGLGAAPVAAFVGVFPSFSFGDETIRNAQLNIADLFALDKEKQINDLIAAPVPDQPQMLLGADFFRSHRVFVAREQHRVYASYEGGPVFLAAPPPRPSAPAKP